MSAHASVPIEVVRDYYGQHVEVYRLGAPGIAPQASGTPVARLVISDGEGGEATAYLGADALRTLRRALKP